MQSLFVAELAKDSEKVPKNINFKRIYTILGTKENQTTRVTLEFLSNVIPVFEKFLLLFQKSQTSMDQILHQLNVRM